MPASSGSSAHPGACPPDGIFPGNAGLVIVALTRSLTTSLTNNDSISTR